MKHRLVVAAALFFLGFIHFAEGKTAEQLMNELLKSYDPDRVSDLKRFPPDEAIPAYYSVARSAVSDGVSTRAKILLVSTFGWDKWFLNELWAVLPASLYETRKDNVAAVSRRKARELIEFLAGIRNPKAIKLLGPILLLDGEMVWRDDVGSPSCEDYAEDALYEMDIDGFPEDRDQDKVREWWIKNKDLTEEQWWGLLQKGHEKEVKRRASLGIPNLPPLPPPLFAPPPSPATPKTAPR